MTIGLLLNTPIVIFAATDTSNSTPTAPTSSTTQFGPENIAPFDTNNIVPSTEEDVELILQTQVKRLILGDTFGIQKNNRTYIGLQSLFDILDFSINVDIEQKSATGWFIKEENKFSMKKKENKFPPIEISSKGIIHSINEQSILYRDDDIYMEANKILTILEIEYKINTYTLTLALFPSEPLPVQDKLARQKRTKSKKRNLSATLPQKHTPYRLWTIPFIDAQTRYISNNTSLNTYSYSALGSGDLAYMTSTYYLQGDKDDKLKNFRMKLSRDSINNDLLGPLKATHFSIGEITPVTSGGIGTTGQEIGAKISNKPFGRNIRVQQTDFVGDTQPGWDVELYRNNIYLGGQTVTDNGRYEFYNQDILPGENEFKLVFYGPQGQRLEKTEEINLSKSGIEMGKTLYDISLTKQNSRFFNVQDNYTNNEQNSRRFNVSLFKDFNKYISLQASYSRYTFLDNTTHNFIKPAVRLFILDTLLFGNITKDINGGNSTYYSVAKSFFKQSLTYSDTNSSVNYLTESSNTEKPAQSIRSVDLSGPLLKSKYLRLNYGLGAKRSITKDISQSDNYNANFSAKLLGFNLTNNLNYIETTLIDSTKTRTVSGIAGLSKTIYQFNFRGRANYLLEPVKGIKLKSVTNLAGNISWLMFTKMRTQYTLGYTPVSNAISHAVSVNWSAKKFTLTSNYTRNSSGNYSIYAGINFSIGYDKNTSKFKIGPERISRTGGISARVFIDDNNNGIHDANEPAVKDVKIQAEQARRHGISDEDGIAFFPGLPVDRRTDIELDLASLKDPFLVSSAPGYSFLPRPGVVESLNVPLVTSGEVEGTIYLENKNGSTQPAGYVSLELTNTKTRQTRSEISAYDGFYLFTNIPPGQYIVSIDKSYLNRYKFGARKPMPRVVTIQATGNVELGNDFTVYPLNNSNSR